MVVLAQLIAEAVLFLLGIVAFIVALVCLGRLTALQRRVDDQQVELEQLRRDLDYRPREAVRQRSESESPRTEAGESTPPQPAAPRPQATQPPPPPPRRTEPVSPSTSQAEPTARGESTGPIPESLRRPKPHPTAAETASSEITAQPATPSTSHVPPTGEPDHTPASRATGGWEERLGAKATVWLGAIALALAGAYLVKYSFDNNLLRPEVRIALGAGFGLLLLIAGEFMLRRSSGVAAALAAAGVADLFACILAATKLYDMLPPIWGFLAMAVVAAAGVGLSLRHGRLVAVVGLVGGFVTPSLIGGGTPDARLTFGYLFLLQLGVLGITRHRGWWALASLTLAGNTLWAVTFLGMLLFDRITEADGTWVGLFALATAGAFVIAGQTDRSALNADDIRARFIKGLNWCSVLAALVLLAALTGARGFAPLDWGLLGVLTAGTMVLARLRTAYQPMLWLVFAAVMVMLTVWAVGIEAEHAMRFLGITRGYAALLIGGGFALMWGSAKPREWALLTTITPFILLAMGYLPDVPLPEGWQWWMIALGLAGVMAALSTAVTVRRRSLGEDPPAIQTIHLTAALALLAISAAMGLPVICLGPCWAILALLSAILARQLTLPAMRLRTVILALLAVGQTLVDPRLYTQTYGPWVVLNELAAVHGVTLLALLAARWLDRPSEADAASENADDGQSAATPRGWLEGLALLLTLAAVALQVRHGFAPVEQGAVDLTAGQLDYWAASTHVLAWGALGALLLVAARWIRTETMQAAGPIAAVLAGITAIALVLARFNPLWVDGAIGDTPILNGLLYGYGAPAVLAGLIAWLAMRRGIREIAQAAGVFAGLNLLVLVTLQVRHLFHGAAMAIRPETAATALEWASYTNLWLALGAAAAWIGRWRDWRSAAMLGLAFALLGAALGLITLGVIRNPLLHPEPVGAWPVLNWLLAMYGLPAVLAAVVAGLLVERWRSAAALLSSAALVMLFALISLQVRQYFHGTLMDLDAGDTTAAEWYTYSVAWIGLGLVLLLAGVLTGIRTVRYGSLAVMGLAVVKVFFSDTAHLENLYRVLSFLGLGLSLLILGFVYQKFVFQPERKSEDPEQNHEAPKATDET